MRTPVNTPIMNVLGVLLLYCPRTSPNPADKSEKGKRESMKAVRAAFLAGCVLLWLFAAALCLQLGGRYWADMAHKQGERYASNKTVQQFEIEQKLVNSIPAPIPPDNLHPAPGAPKRESFLELTDSEQKRHFAAQREEAVLECTGEGRVLAVHAPVQPEHLSFWAKGLENGADLTALFDGFEGQRAEMRRNVQNFYSAPTEFRITDTNRKDYCLEVRLLPATAGAPGTVRLLCFIRESLYEDYWLRFRPHCYRDDLWSPCIVWTNNAGFRGNDVILPKPQGVYRIVCVGGSTTFEGRRNDLTYPCILQAKLREFLRTDRVEVINAGVPSLNSAKELQRFDDYLALQPDMIIHYNFVNDIGGIPGALAAAKVNDGSLGERALGKLKQTFLWPLPSSLPSKSDFRQTIQCTLSNMKAMADKAHGAGVRMAFCSFAFPRLEAMQYVERIVFEDLTSKPQGVPWSFRHYCRAVEAYNDAIRELAEAGGDLYVPVSEEMAGGMNYFRDICHLYLPAIQLKADIIARHLAPEISASLR